MALPWGIKWPSTDSQFNTESDVELYRTQQCQILEAQLADPEFRRQPDDLKTRHLKHIEDIKAGGKLSNVQVMKGLLLMQALYRSFTGALSYFVEKVYDDDWETISLVFDQQDKNFRTAMEDWVDREFRNVITNQSARNRVELHRSWFTRPHPLLRGVGDAGDGRIPLGTIFRDRIDFPPSEDRYQLQIVDWISNTIFKVLKRELSVAYLYRIDGNMARPNGQDTKVLAVRFISSDANGLYPK